MTSRGKNLSLRFLLLLAFLGSGLRGYAQTTLYVDSTQSWIGYMSVFALPADGGGYVFGQPWGTSDLRAHFDPTGTNVVTLTGCTNVWETNDTFWVQGDGVSPNKTTDASFYVQNDTLAGQNLTFNGNCLTNTLVDPFTSVAFIKDFNAGYSIVGQVSVPLVSGQPFSISLYTTPGDHIQYGFETVGPDVNPSDLTASGEVLIAVNNVDPTVPPIASEVVVQGQNATLTVAPKGTAPFNYQWAYVTPTSTNILSNGAGIFGATTSSLTITNVTLADAGNYMVTVGNSKGIAAANASLLVLPLAQVQTNLLIDPSFELGLVDNTHGTAGWDYYSGSILVNTNNYYYLSSVPVSVLDGTNCVQVYAGGAYNGVFQERPATPGAIYTANAWFYCPSADPITGGNVCYLEVHFLDAAGNLILDYKSSLVSITSVQDTWFSLSPTNILLNDYVTQIGTSPYMVAPPGTAKVHFQITMAAGGGSGSVYVDNLDLRLRAPGVAASVGSSHVNLTFPSLYGITYNVLFKNSLTDPTWSTLSSVLGDGTVKTVSDLTTSKAKFYIVNTQ